MLDEQGKQNFFQQLHTLWIKPELDKRFEKKEIPADFKIWQCRIKLPTNEPPIVEFNNEIGWLTENPTLAPGIEMEVDKPVYLHELTGIGRILPPTVNEKRVAFIYLFWNGFSYECFFDFLPNQPDYDPEDEKYQFDGTVIANFLNKYVLEIVVRLANNTQDKLRQIGLWTVTSLLPYPMSKIIERVGSGAFEDARAILVSYCDADFIEKLVGTWYPITAFADRLPLFYECVFTHRNGKFGSTIYTLIPQIEGIITDWLHSIGIADVEHVVEKKISQFRELILNIPNFEFAYREALESSIEFVLAGPPLKNFGRWLNKIDTSFAGRHPISHGKYQDDIFTEENSIKLFLLLDTICQFMMFYEMHVLDRNLGQNSQSE